jgi:hypothetical protein
VASGIEGRVQSLTLKGVPWDIAVEALYDYFEANAQAIFDAFRDQQEPYAGGF